MKVLIAVGETNRGGTETWLLHIAREVQGRCQIDFLVHSGQEGAYDRQLSAFGARVIPCGNPRNPLAFGREFLRILRDSGPYDVVHSHVQCYSAWILLLAWIAGVKVRVAHSHSDLGPGYRRAGFCRKSYMRAMKALLRIFPTHYLATSPAAAVSLFGKASIHDPRYRQHLSCVDLAPLAQPYDRGLVRRSLGISDDVIVVGHVGSFRPEKNHRFAIEVAERLSRLSSRYRFLFQGDGVLKAEVQDIAIRLGIADRCLFLPSGDDVPRLLRGAIDLFLFPSVSEGLGLAVVEAQAAGLRCFVSEAVPAEAIPVPELVERLTLRDGPDAWASAIHAKSELAPPLSPEQALQRTRDSGFDIRRNAEALLELYTGAAAPGGLRAFPRPRHYSLE
jgi:glycosyltransferase involved in cell wall biosynthesis